MRARSRTAALAEQSPTKAPWASLVLGLLCGTLLTVIYMAPARWLASAVDTATDGRLQLQAAQGSIWSGSAQWVLGAGRSSGITETLALPGRMAWQWGLGWQAGPSVRLVLRTDCCRQGPIGLQAAWNSANPMLSIDAIAEQDSLRIPAKLLNALGAPWNSLQLDGTIAFSGTALQIPLQAHASDPLWSGQWQLDLLNIESSISTLRPLGSYRISSGVDSRSPIAVSTLNGYLQVQGQGQLISKRLRFQGHAQAAEGSEDALDNLLNIIGRRQGARTLLQIG